MNFLSQVTHYKQKEIDALKVKQVANPFSALFTGGKKPVFIAEIKPKSPSGGVLFKGDFIELAKSYEDAGVDAISVLTDKPSFGGSIELLRNVRRVVNVPILRKDIILDKSQLVESLVSGANAVLLISSLLSRKKVKEFLLFSQDLGLVPVIEISNEHDLETAVLAGATIVGVNARNLHTLEVNVDRALTLLSSIPQNITSLLFSGVQTHSDINEAVKLGASGVLVGTSILKSPSPKQKIEELIHG